MKKPDATNFTSKLIILLIIIILLIFLYCYIKQKYTAIPQKNLSQNTSPSSVWKQENSHGGPAAGRHQNIEGSNQPFAPAPEYSAHRGAFRLDAGLMDDLKDVLQLDESQWSQLKNYFETFISRIASLQSESAYASVDTTTNRPIIYFRPAVAQWTGIENELISNLNNIIGKRKTEYFLNISKDQIAMLTGDFGRMPRTMEFMDRRLDKQTDSSMPDWQVLAYGGSSAGSVVAHYFPQDLRSVFQDQGSSKITSIGMNFEFNETDIPPFLKPFIEIQKQSGN